MVFSLYIFQLHFYTYFWAFLWCYVPLPSYTPWLDHPNNRVIWRIVRIMKLILHFFFSIVLRILLLPLALQPTVGFGLSNNVFPFFPISFYSYFLFPSFPGSSPSSRPFQFLSEDFFWSSYPPLFSLGDLTSLPFAVLSSLLYFLLCSSLLVLDSPDFSIPRFHI